MNFNFDINRTRWNSIIYNPALTSVRNENCNEQFIKTLEEQNFTDARKYPNLHKCYDLITEFFAIDSSTVIFGFGSDQILKDLFLTLEYDTIQIFDESWAMAPIYNKIFNKTILPNHFSFRDGTFHLTQKPEDVGGDVLYIVNPHCPTGVEFGTDDILELSAKFKYVIVDGTYEHPLKLDKRLLERKNIIVVKSFSKLGGVPGMRVGYCIADKAIIDKMFVIKPLYEMCVMSVRYLEFILNPNGVKIIDDHITELKKCFEILKGINGGRFSYQGGNFAVYEDFGKLKGRQHTIDGLKIVRVTLTDSKNAHQLVL